MRWLTIKGLNQNNRKTVHSFVVSVGMGLILFLMIIMFAGCPENDENGPPEQEPRYTIENHTPCIALGGDGQEVMVWARDTDNPLDYTGEIRQLCAGSLITGSCFELTDDRDSTADEQYGAAVDSSGNVIAVWEEYSRVYWNRFDAASGTWQSKETLSNPDNIGALLPRVSMNTSGIAMVTWFERVAESSGIYTLKSRYLNGPGAGVAGDVSAPEVQFPWWQSSRVVVFSDGSALAVWTQGQNGDHQLYSNTYAPSAGWGTPESRGIDILRYAGGDLQVATNISAPGNMAVLTWVSYSPENDRNIYACIYQSGTWSSVETLNDTLVSNENTQLETAMDSLGRAMVVWMGEHDYCFNRYVPGTDWQGMGTLPGLTTSETSFVKMAMDNEGTAGVVSQGNIIWYDPAQGWGNVTTFDDQADAGTPSNIHPLDETVIAADAAGHFVAAYSKPYTSTNPDNRVTRVVRTHTWGPPLAYFSFNSNPQANLPVSFDAGASRDDDGTIESYEWDFGDGGTGTGEEISHTFSAAGAYVVTLTVTDDEGQSSTISRTVTIALSPPVAEFTYSPANPHSQEDVSFDASGSHDPDGTIVRYDWDFGGDEVLDAGVDPAYWFENPGTYTVTLVVTDNDGLTAETSQTIAVGTEPPVAGFTFEPAAPTVGEEVTFTSTSTDDGTIVGYLWNFGDGATADTQNAAHTYGAAGSYSVTLLVEDNEGNTAAAVGTVTVYGAVEYTLTVTYAGGCEGYVVSEPDGISETSSSAQFSSGTEVTLHPEPYSGCVFSHWGGDLSGSGDQSLVMDGNKQVEAWFE